MDELQTMIRPYDIQRGTIRKGYADTARYSEAVENDYMGSSEFEWGALPASLRCVQAEREHLSVLTVVVVKDLSGRPLLAYGNFTTRIDPVEYGEAIRAVAYSEERTREYTAFDHHVQPSDGRKRFRVTDVWWDINNDVFMSFDASFIANLPRILANSWAYMDSSQVPA